MPFSATPTDAEICAWFDAQSEEFLRDLFDRFDASTPRECWSAFFCPSPAAQTVATSLPAPAAGQGAGTLFKLPYFLGLFVIPPCGRMVKVHRGICMYGPGLTRGFRWPA